MAANINSYKSGTSMLIILIVFSNNRIFIIYACFSHANSGSKFTSLSILYVFILSNYMCINVFTGFLLLTNHLL